MAESMILDYSNAHVHVVENDFCAIDLRKVRTNNRFRQTEAYWMTMTREVFTYYAEHLKSKLNVPLREDQWPPGHQFAVYQTYIKNELNKAFASITDTLLKDSTIGVRLTVENLVSNSKAAFLMAGLKPLANEEGIRWGSLFDLQPEGNVRLNIEAMTTEMLRLLKEALFPNRDRMRKVFASLSPTCDGNRPLTAEPSIYSRVFEFGLSMIGNDGCVLMIFGIRVKPPPKVPSLLIMCTGDIVNRICTYRQNELADEQYKQLQSGVAELPVKLKDKVEKAVTRMNEKVNGLEETGREFYDSDTDSVTDPTSSDHSAAD